MVIARLALAAALLLGCLPARAGLDVSADVSAVAQAVYASPCSVTVNTSTPTSVFCPVATDPQSVVKRTYPAAFLVPGKSFRLDGGGTYTVPATNTLSADIAIKVGSATVMSITTPAAPVATNAGVDFHAVCTVRATPTISCQGMFAFVVLGGTYAPVAFSQSNTFDPTVSNMVDVMGDWNGTTTSHATVVTQAVLTKLN